MWMWTNSVELSYETIPSQAVKTEGVETRRSLPKSKDMVKV